MASASLGGDAQSSPAIIAGHGNFRHWIFDTSSAETRAIASGAIGGPFSVFVLTPQRNAMTLSAKEYSMNFVGLYRQVFFDGLQKGFRGGMRPTIMAVPQFTAIGPVYIAMEQKTRGICGNVPMSMLGASLVESLLTYSAQARNAQIQFNAALARPVAVAAAAALPAQPLELAPISRVMGPGFTCHVLRNYFAMLGIRLLSPHSRRIVEQSLGEAAPRVDSRLLDFSADAVSSVAAALLSMPFNQIFSWAVCTPQLQELSYLERTKRSYRFLAENYTKHRLPLLGRDLLIRICYTGSLFTIYRSIERRIIE